MNDLENLYAEFKYEMDEFKSFVEILLIAAEQEDAALEHENIVHNVEIMHEKITKLCVKANILREKMIESIAA